VNTNIKYKMINIQHFFRGEGSRGGVAKPERTERRAVGGRSAAAGRKPERERE